MGSLAEDAGLLLEGLRLLDDGVLAEGKACEAAKVHTPRPWVLHKVSLTPWWQTPLAQAWVCGTDMDLLVMYQQLMYIGKGHVPYRVANRFAVPLRRLVQRGWDLYVAESTAKE